MNRIQMKQPYSIAMLVLIALLALAPIAAGQQVFRDHGPNDGIVDLAAALATQSTLAGPQTLTVSTDIEYLIQQLDQDFVMNYLEDLVAFGPRVTGTTACHDAGDYIYQQFEDMGLDVSYHNWSLWGYNDRNVVATLPDSSGVVDDIYIVCAHYDSVTGSPGADDNGSGTAAVMALANILRNCSFDATLRFVAFSGEEQGLLGSNIYADDARNNGDNIIAVINADMIGYATSSSDDKIKIPYDSQSTWLKDEIVAAAQAYNHLLGLTAIPSYGSGGSDHVSFWKENYHAAGLFEYEFNAYYHSSGDTIAHMDLDYFTRSSQLFLASFAEVAGPPVLNAFADIKVDGQDGPLSIPSTQTVALTISLDSFSQLGIAHDWWITAERNGTKLFSWVYKGGWQSSPTPIRAYGGPLRNLQDFTVSTGKLPPGSWILTFAVDELNNTYEGTYADTIEVTSY